MSPLGFPSRTTGLDFLCLIPPAPDPFGTAKLGLSTRPPVPVDLESPATGRVNFPLVTSGYLTDSEDKWVYTISVFFLGLHTE